MAGLGTVKVDVAYGWMIYALVDAPGHGRIPVFVTHLSWRFDAELAHEDAAIATGGPALPVIVFSHGSVNDPINSAHLLERIAADGFIVAAPTHVTDTQEDVRIEFINTRLGATLAAQLPTKLRTCLLGLPRPCSRPTSWAGLRSSVLQVCSPPRVASPT